ncbi:hypothetical protein Tco_0187822, partial [Tanacetum coccineum]
IIAPMMTTRNVGQHTTATRVGRIGGQGGGRGNRANKGVNEVPEFVTVIAQQLQGLLSTIVAQEGDHVNNQGNIGSQNDNIVDDNIHEDDRNVNIGYGRNGYSYKDFMTCKPKEFDGKAYAVDYSAGSLTGRALTWWNFGVRTRGHEAVVGMTWEDFKALMKEECCPSNGMQR